LTPSSTSLLIENLEEQCQKQDQYTAEKRTIPVTFCEGDMRQSFSALRQCKETSRPDDPILFTSDDVWDSNLEDQKRMDRTLKIAAIKKLFCNIL
jgi:hypothetical protein